MLGSGITKLDGAILNLKHNTFRHGVHQRAVKHFTFMDGLLSLLQLGDVKEGGTAVRDLAVLVIDRRRARQPGNGAAIFAHKLELKIADIPLFFVDGEVLAEGVLAVRRHQFNDPSFADEFFAGVAQPAQFGVIDCYEPALCIQRMVAGGGVIV